MITPAMPNFMWGDIPGSFSRGTVRPALS